MKKAFFLDRDGVITEDPPHYAHRIDQLKIVSGSAEAIHMLNDKKIKVIVISNQSGIARGMYSEEKTFIFNKALQSELNKKNARIDGFYHCPHHPQAKIDKYKKICNCRKPEPGMILQAASEHDIKLSDSFMIGDRKSDIVAGKKAGCKTVLVLTGVGAQQKSKYEFEPDFTYSNLFEAVSNILDKS